jgi:hypothetical protein
LYDFFAVNSPSPFPPAVVKHAASAIRGIRDRSGIFVFMGLIIARD